MNAVGLSLIFIALCLIREYSGSLQNLSFGVYYQFESDDDFRDKLNIADTEHQQLNVLYFTGNTPMHDTDIRILARNNPTVAVYKINTSSCINSTRLYGVVNTPTVILRQAGTNKIWFNAPISFPNLKKKIREVASNKGAVTEITMDDALINAMDEADKGDQLVITYIVNGDNCKDIEPVIEIVAELYKSSIKVYKINAAILKDIEDQYGFVDSAKKNSYPKVIYRIHGMIRHILYGFSWSQFHNPILEYKDKTKTDILPNEAEFSMGIKETTLYKSYTDVTCYDDFKNHLRAAESAKKLIVLYIVNGDDFKGVDKSVKVMARVYQTITIIRVDVKKCHEIKSRYPDEGTTNVIKTLPKFIVQRFQRKLAVFAGYDGMELSLKIQQYIDIDEHYFDKDAAIDEPKPSPLEGIQNRLKEVKVQRQDRYSERFEYLPNIINGNKFTHQQLETRGVRVNYSLADTSAFDSILSLLMVAYSDSSEYKQKINKERNTNKLFDLISTIVTNGKIDWKNYSYRVELLMRKVKADVRISLRYESTYSVLCNVNVEKIVESFFEGFPTRTLIMEWTDNNRQHSLMDTKTYISYKSPDGKLTDLQNFLDSSFMSIIRNNYIHKTTISDMHIFIDVLNIKIRDPDDPQKVKEKQLILPLSGIPRILRCGTQAYLLRGVISYKKGTSITRTNDQNYYAYAYRGHLKWQLFNDIKDEVEDVLDESKEIIIDYLLYTI